MVDSPLVVKSTITIKVSKAKLFPQWSSCRIMKFHLMSHLPESLKLPLFDPEQLAGLSADNGSVARRVVQDRLPKGCPNPQRADCDCILHTDMTTFSYCISITGEHLLLSKHALQRHSECRYKAVKLYSSSYKQCVLGFLMNSDRHGKQTD